MIKELYLEVRSLELVFAKESDRMVSNLQIWSTCIFKIKKAKTTCSGRVSVGSERMKMLRFADATFLLGSNGCGT